MIKILCSFIESFFVVLDSDLLYEKAPLNFVTTIFNLSYCPPPNILSKTPQPTPHKEATASPPHIQATAPPPHLSKSPTLPYIKL